MMIKAEGKNKNKNKKTEQEKMPLVSKNYV